MASAEGIGYSLDVQLDDYALVNMQGFTQIIDAIGGVTVELPEERVSCRSHPGSTSCPSR